MKLVTAIFKPSRLDAVIDALGEADVSGLTVSLKSVVMDANKARPKSIAAQSMKSVCCLR